MEAKGWGWGEGAAADGLMRDNGEEVGCVGGDGCGCCYSEREGMSVAFSPCG